MDQLSERLKKQRESLGISVAQLAERTKVREPYIRAIEQGMYTMLPQVYIRSFLRSIGLALGIPSTELQRLIASVIDNPTANANKQGAANIETSGTAELLENTTDSVTKLINKSTSGLQGAYQQVFRKRSSVLTKRRVFALAVCVALIAAAYLVFFNSSNQRTIATSSDIIDITEDSLALTATTVDTCEFTITIDGRVNEKVVLIPGEDYAWNASEKFVINNIFNAGSISFRLNNNLLPRYGNTGEVLRELTITRKEVIASNAPAVTNVIPKSNPTVDSAMAVKKRDTIQSRQNKSVPRFERKQLRNRAPQNIITRAPKRSLRD